jgi:CBS domain-containing protein
MNEQLCIRDVMSKQLVSIDADSNAFQAAKKMSKKISALSLSQIVVR